MACEKDYSLDGKDRPEWDRLWGATTLRLLPGPCRLDLQTDFAPLRVKAYFLSPDPVEFAGRMDRQSDCCPVCGESTAGGSQVAVTLYVEFDKPAGWPSQSDFTLGFSAWAHPACFERCQGTGRPAGIPW
jgi:hypothetical protein